ncbi:hypothetical protein EDB81DRAFT_678308 [Dactylonectria macrodidyma]|uniref:Uncharacterized protein n=1 Tax=Dactylonectria macrodidyma TaxID=307937 RepID=A0A9P9FSU7_9HYPO|nr:hypothetical protein EDB81DRAFT_678308 [Dactylonectria macrodidyma]
MASQEEQARRRLILEARSRQLQISAARQQETQPRNVGTMAMTMGPAMGSSMGSSYDDVPITEPDDLLLLAGETPLQPDFAPFQAACRNGPLSTVELIVASKLRTPAFLHQGLILALGSGNVDAARYLFGAKAPIARQTPIHILSAPSDRKTRLFEILTQHGWSPNTPGFYGAVLFPRIVSNVALLEWFLRHGADPNLGAQRDNRDCNGPPETDSCSALEAAASHGSVEAVQKLVSAGAQIRNGAPLYFAAGVCPPGANPHAGLVTPSREFDAARVRIMALLVENCADVNQKLESRHMTPQYPTVNAVMAGAVGRVRWLLNHEADPALRGAFGSASEYAHRMGSEDEKGY